MLDTQLLPLFVNPERQLKSHCPWALHDRTPFGGACIEHAVHPEAEQPLLGPNRTQAPLHVFSPLEQDPAAPP